MERLERVTLTSADPTERVAEYVEKRGGEIVRWFPGRTVLDIELRRKLGSRLEPKVAVCCGEGHVWTVRASKLASDQTWCPRCAPARQSLGIEGAQEIARQRGGECLSSTYKNSHTMMRWRCSKGHVFEQTTNEIKHKGQWCPECWVELPLFSRARRTFPELVESLAKVGIEHIGSGKAFHRPTRWHCQCGYEWRATGRAMIKRKRDKLCQGCAGTAPPTIEDMERWAVTKGGHCLSTEYINNRHKLRWQCANGHEWTAKWSNIRGGTWCPFC